MSLKTPLPNIRKIFVPDPGYVIYDCDLVGADAQVVAWTAGDEDLKNAFRAGLDVHSKNAEDMFGSAYTNLPGDKNSGPKSRKRKEVKQGVHLTNYLGRAPTMAKVLGWTVHESDLFQKRWFSIHPPILAWHNRVHRGLLHDRTVRNAFGDRRVYFDRIDSILPEAVAWEPQCSVAIVCFEGGLALEQKFPFIEMLLQNHDSLVFQLPIERDTLETRRAMRDALHIPIPFDDPLYIPWGFDSSGSSWGDVKPVVL